jgi:hypothetical protein
VTRQRNEERDQRGSEKQRGGEGGGAEIDAGGYVGGEGESGTRLTPREKSTDIVQLRQSGECGTGGGEQQNRAVGSQREETRAEDERHWPQGRQAEDEGTNGYHASGIQAVGRTRGCQSSEQVKIRAGKRKDTFSDGANGEEESGRKRRTRGEDRHAAEQNAHGPDHRPMRARTARGH